MIRFGAWSTILGLAAAFGALVALRLATTRVNRTADRFLAALMLVAILRLGPYVIGFAGFYDAYPWLTFAPFDQGLAVGPLLYLYIETLTAGRAPRRWAAHLIPAAIQLAYTLWAFALPLQRKFAWNHTVHGVYIDPLETAAAMFSLAVYLLAAARTLRRYERWLRGHRGDGDEHRQPWLRNVLIALALWLAVSAGYDGFSALVRRLSYFDRFSEYLAFSGIILWLGLEGWRYADHRFPPMAPARPADPPAPSPGKPPRDWRREGEAWAARIQAEGWWREPAITLPDVACRLGTNESYLSRALNEGLGVSFNGLINRMRVEAVKASLAAGEDGDLLRLALDAGFGSKASFNRAFRAEAGVSPSVWRAERRQGAA